MYLKKHAVIKDYIYLQIVAGKDSKYISIFELLYTNLSKCEKMLKFMECQIYRHKCDDQQQDQLMKNTKRIEISNLKLQCPQGES